MNFRYSKRCLKIVTIIEGCVFNMIPQTLLSRYLWVINLKVCTYLHNKLITLNKHYALFAERMIVKIKLKLQNGRLGTMKMMGC